MVQPVSVGARSSEALLLTDTMTPFRLGDAITKGAGLRPVEHAELSPEFRSGLSEVFASDPNVAGAWLTWLTWPKAPSELIIGLLLDRPDEQSLQQILARIGALGGPSCIGLLQAKAPADQAFYSRTRT